LKSRPIPVTVEMNRHFHVLRQTIHDALLTLLGYDIDKEILHYDDG
jgi:hypothetical protein